MKTGTYHQRELSSEQISMVVARYRSSGLGAIQFAREQGIPAGRLHYWIYQKGRTKPRPPRRRLVSNPLFQEVKVATLLPEAARWAAEVSLPRGLALRFSQSAPAEWIGALVQALQRPC
jgi:hypothetical protein